MRACVYACVSVFCLLWQLHIFVSAQNKRLASRHKVDFVATKLPSVFAELCKKRVVVAKSVRLHVQTHGIAAANVPFLIYIYLFIYCWQRKQLFAAAIFRFVAATAHSISELIGVTRLAEIQRRSFGGDQVAWPKTNC